MCSPAFDLPHSHPVVPPSPSPISNPLCFQTGVIPNSLVQSMGSPERLVDVRYNNLSCCGRDYNATTGL